MQQKQRDEHKDKTHKNELQLEIQIYRKRAKKGRVNASMLNA
jgi:hypothetical protein